MSGRWLGPRPQRCDICSVSLDGKSFVDGVVKKSGPWAIMCKDCHATHGSGLGVGRGQEYDAEGRKVC